MNAYAPIAMPHNLKYRNVINVSKVGNAQCSDGIAAIGLISKAAVMFGSVLWNSCAPSSWIPSIT